MNINEFHPFSGRFVKEDGTTVNIADGLGGKSVSDKVYDINNMMPHSGRFIKEDGTCVNIADMIANGDIGGGGSSDDSAPPIVEAYNGQTIQCSMSADRPLKGLNLYATCKQETYEGKNLFNLDDLLSLIPGSGTDMTEVELKVTGLIPNTTYTLSSTIEGSVNGHYTNRCLYFGDKEVNNCVFAGRPVSISSGNNGEVLVYLYPFRDIAQDIKSGNGNVQLEEGAVPTTYEPYTGGVPSPSVDYPQEIQTTSDFTVEVKSSMEEDTTPQTLDITIPEQEFYGIPVSSGGNYTDASGKQWICDEFDFANKKFIKRTGRISFDGSEDEVWGKSTTGEKAQQFAYTLPNGKDGYAQCLCNKFIYGAATKEKGECFTWNSRFFICVDTSISTVTLLRDYLNTHQLDVIYMLETPAEYNLTDEQVEQYKKLRSYYSTTYIDNDAVPACNMQAELVLDTKLYIDSKFATLAGQILEVGA